MSILLSIPLAMYAAATPSKLQRKLQDTNTELERFRSIINKYVVTACTKSKALQQKTFSYYH